MSGWDGSGATMATIHVVAPTPTPTATNTTCTAGASISSILLNGQPTTEITVGAGESVRFQFSFQIWNAPGLTARRQLVAGYNVGGQRSSSTTPGYDGVPAQCPSKTSGTYNQLFAAPTTPGDYILYVDGGWQFTCANAIAAGAAGEMPRLPCT